MIKKIIAEVALSIILLASSEALSTIYYVDCSKGNNSNKGTSENAAFKTIQKAADIMKAGDYCLVFAGDYPERVSIKTSGSKSAPIVFQAEGTVITKGFSIKANNIHIIGFDITGIKDCSYASNAGIYVAGKRCNLLNNYIHHINTAGIYFYVPTECDSSTSYCIVRENIISYTGYVGIYVRGCYHLIEDNDISHQFDRIEVCNEGDVNGISFFGYGHVFRKNYIHDIYYKESSGSPHIDGLQTWGPAYNILFEANIISMPDNQDQGFMIEALFPPVKDLTFKNNIFLMNATTYAPTVRIITKNGQQTISGLIFVNNTCISLNRVKHLVDMESCVNVKIRNNIFYYPGIDATGVDNYWRLDRTTGVDIGNNLLYIAHNNYPNSSPRQNDIWRQDPKFVDAVNENFHLRSYSPAIDAGVNLDEVTEDFDGISRPQGLYLDIGAYEYRIISPPQNVRLSPP